MTHELKILPEKKERERKKAIWFDDYDYLADKRFKRPGCPECYAPIGNYEKGKYRCFSCGHEVVVEEPEMKEWFRKREGTKVELWDDPVIKDETGKVVIGCGGKKCKEVHFVRNPLTLKWQVGWGVCKQCGQRFIV